MTETLRDALRKHVDRYGMPKIHEPGDPPEPESMGAIEGLYRGLNVGVDRATIAISDLVRDRIPLEDSPFIKTQYEQIAEEEAKVAPADRESAFYQGGQSTPLSLGIMVPSMAAGMGVQAITTPVLGPAGGLAAGAVTSGAVSAPIMYKVGYNQALREVRDAIKEKYDITPEQWDAVQETIETEVHKAGLAEAGGEALSEVLGFALFRVPIGVIGKPIAGLIGKKATEKIIGNVVARAGVRLTGEMGSEIAGETATQVAQNQSMYEIQGKIPADARVSSSDYDPDASLLKRTGKAFTEVAGPTAVQSAFMVGGRGAVSGLARLAAPKKEAPPPPAPTPAPTPTETPAPRQQPRTSRPATPAEPQGPTPREIFGFARRIADGEDMQSAEDLQFYDDNREAIENSLAAIKNFMRPSSYDESKLPPKFYPPALYVEPERQKMLPPGQGFELVDYTKGYDLVPSDTILMDQDGVPRVIRPEEILEITSEEEGVEEVTAEPVLEPGEEIPQVITPEEIAAAEPVVEEPVDLTDNTGKGAHRAAPEPVETPEPVKDPADLTPEELTQLYIETERAKLPPGEDGSRAIKETAPKLIGRLAKRLSGWKRTSELTVKDRLGKPQQKEAIEGINFLKEVGHVQVAWDNQGNPHYAKANEPLPEWLTQSEDDADLANVPDKPKSPEAIAAELEIDYLGEANKIHSFHVPVEKNGKTIKTMASLAVGETPTRANVEQLIAKTQEKFKPSERAAKEELTPEQREIEVETKVMHEKGGAILTVKEKAGTVLDEIDATMEKYLALLECVS